MPSTASPTLGRWATEVAELDHCLLLLRHGRTAYNDEDRLTTRTDVPLTALGESQALHAASALAGARFDSVWASPLGRARQTARLALSYAVPVGSHQLDERLVEPDAGHFEGECFSDLRDGPLAADFSAYQNEEDPVVPASCEPWEQTLGRVRSFLAEVMERPGRHLAVSHGALIRILVAEFLGLNPAYYRRMKLDNCHAVLLKFWPTPPHQLVFFNDAP